MGLNSVNTNTPGWFENRTVACRNILDNMTDAEKEKLCKKAEEMAEKGMPEDIQRK